MTSTKLIGIAIEMARRWGVMETLEDLPSMHEIPVIGEDGIRETIFSWAKEYMDTKQTDMTLFLKEKLDKLKKQKDKS